MGESIVEALNVENKMGESISSGSTLEVSISFGRFDNDSLSWEKWSSFSPNKYLEEVEKCSTPGSVAQKKAYFEAHYKKIAARKAEILVEQEKQISSDYVKDHSGSTYGTEIEFGGISDGVEGNPNSLSDMELGVSNNYVETVMNLGVSNDQGSPKGIEQETGSISVVSSTDFGAPKEDASIVEASQSTVVEGVDEEIDSVSDSLEVKKPEEAVLIQEDAHLKGSWNIEDLPPKLDKERGSNSERKEATAKSVASMKPQKISPTKKEKNVIGSKKKVAVAPPLPKSPKVFTPKLSKPAMTSAVISTSRSSTKNSKNSLLPKSNRSSGESKRVSPMSLHMSLSFSPANSDSTSLTTPRKSMIMEKMGDKDIVRRAFKTFQNSFNQLRSSSDEISSGTKQVLIKGTEQKSSTSLTLRRENDGTRKSADKINAVGDKSGTRRNFMLSGSSNRAGVDQRKGKAAPSSFGLRSDEKADKQKVFHKKLEEKSSVKEAERAQLSSKPKENKDVGMKKLRQSLDFKATPLPRVYMGQGISKSALNKEGFKKENHRR